MSAISLSGLAKAYRQHPVVSDVDLDIAEGEFVVLVGGRPVAASRPFSR